MLKTIVKNGVITEVQDTCASIEEARAEKLAEVREARGYYFDKCWHKLGYNQIDRDMVVQGTADATITTEYTRLLNKANTEYDRVAVAVADATTNNEVYHQLFQLEVPDVISRSDLDSNGIIDWLENLVV